MLVAFLVAGVGKWPDAALSRALGSMHFASRDIAHIGGTAAIIYGIAVVLAVCALLYRAGRSGDEGRAKEATE